MRFIIWAGNYVFCLIRLVSDLSVLLGHLSRVIRRFILHACQIINTPPPTQILSEHEDQLNVSVAVHTLFCTGNVRCQIVISSLDYVHISVQRHIAAFILRWAVSIVYTGQCSCRDMRLPDILGSLKYRQLRSHCPGASCRYFVSAVFFTDTITCVQVDG